MFNLDTDDEKREKVASHEFIDANGVEVEETETATGYRYTLVARPSDPFVWQWEKANDAERRMLALFGAKTLATNETSQIRNAKKNKGLDTTDEQLLALRDRFKMVNEGQWVDRTREGGIRVDKAKLAAAIVQVLMDLGKITKADEGNVYATKLKELEENPDYLRKSRQVAEVAAAYAALMGWPVATVDML